MLCNSTVTITKSVCGCEYIQHEGMCTSAWSAWPFTNIWTKPKAKVYYTWWLFFEEVLRFRLQYPAARFRNGAHRPASLVRWQLLWFHPPSSYKSFSLISQFSLTFAVHMLTVKPPCISDRETLKPVATVRTQLTLSDDLFCCLFLSNFCTGQQRLIHNFIHTTKGRKSWSCVCFSPRG